MPSEVIVNRDEGLSCLIVLDCSCYGRPKICHCPSYPGLANDVQSDGAGNRGTKCSKYFSQYGERRLTGGIMCVWCTHSVCYGFHCIPRGQGYNNVFSALITWWEKPPKRVVYDFACALGPYCMTREADFFADMLFLIDGFHAKGHTKCSPAAFLSTYSDVDPRLHLRIAQFFTRGLSCLFRTDTEFVGYWNRTAVDLRSQIPCARHSVDTQSNGTERGMPIIWDKRVDTVDSHHNNQKGRYGEIPPYHINGRIWWDCTEPAQPVNMVESHHIR